VSALIGELAALGTSFFFSFTSTLFTLAGRQVGAMVVNRTRLLLAVLVLMLIHFTFLGSLLPTDASSDHWVWLGLSGIVGLVMGDAFLFQAFIWIGPRLSMLMMSLAPVIATLLAWFFLDETLGIWQIAGILITISGIVWVVMERSEAAKMHSANPNHWRGILFGLGAATGQAGGLILAKLGLSGNFNPISGNAIRMVSAAALLWAITLVQGKAVETISTIHQNRRAASFMLIGAITGPVLGVSLSLLAVQNAEVGVASTLMALPPVFLLPISRLIFKEQFGWRAILGTIVAIIGVALLFLV
jgi:drug/metabolite transporter (DMT)-like permease